MEESELQSLQESITDLTDALGTLRQLVYRLQDDLRVLENKVTDLERNS